MRRLAHVDHPVAAPVSERRVAQLVAALSVPHGGRILDLACGQGAWLMVALRQHPGARGVGVDVSRPALAQARDAAARMQLRARVEWVQADATSWSEARFDAVVCVGASHVFGGLDGTLDAVRARLNPGGQALLGDGIWNRPPTQAAQDAIQAGPDDYPDLAGLVSRVRRHGFEVAHGHVSTQEEWDDYEWAWTGSLVRWALAQPLGSAHREDALRAARGHRDAWLGGYREQLGFATLVLMDLGDAA